MLVEAVAARVPEGVEPSGILVSLRSAGRRGAAQPHRGPDSATTAGSAAMTMSEPIVRTFPGYAFGLLRHAAADADEPAPRLLTGPEQDAVIRDLLADPDSGTRIGWPDSLRHAVRTRAFAAELRDLMFRAAERGIGPGNLARLGRDLRRPFWVAAARFMRGVPAGPPPPGREYARQRGVRPGGAAEEIEWTEGNLTSLVHLGRLGAEVRLVGHVHHRRRQQPDRLLEPRGR